MYYISLIIGYNRLTGHFGWKSRFRECGRNRNRWQAWCRPSMDGCSQFCQSYTPERARWGSQMSIFIRSGMHRNLFAVPSLSSESIALLMESCHLQQMHRHSNSWSRGINIMRNLVGSLTVSYTVWGGNLFQRFFNMLAWAAWQLQNSRRTTIFFVLWVQPNVLWNSQKTYLQNLRNKLPPQTVYTQYVL